VPDLGMQEHIVGVHYWKCIQALYWSWYEGYRADI